MRTAAQRTWSSRGPSSRTNDLLLHRRIHGEVFDLHLRFGKVGFQVGIFRSIFFQCRVTGTAAAAQPFVQDLNLDEFGVPKREVFLSQLAILLFGLLQGRWEQISIKLYLNNLANFIFPNSPPTEGFFRLIQYTLPARVWSEPASPAALRPRRRRRHDDLVIQPFHFGIVQLFQIRKRSFPFRDNVPQLGHLLLAQTVAFSWCAGCKAGTLRGHLHLHGHLHYRRSGKGRDRRPRAGRPDTCRTWDGGRWCSCARASCGSSCWNPCRGGSSFASAGPSGTRRSFSSCGGRGGGSLGVKISPRRGRRSMRRWYSSSRGGCAASGLCRNRASGSG